MKDTLTHRVFHTGVDGSSNNKFFATSNTPAQLREGSKIVGVFEVPADKEKAFLDTVRDSRGKTAEAVRQTLQELIN